VLIAVLLALGVGLALLLLSGGGPVLGMEGDAFADLLRLGVLGTVIGAGVLAMARGRWSETARNLAIWVGAFAVLIALYSSGPELRNVGDRMLASLLPGRAVETVGGGNAQVLVTRARDDHFHIDARIDGRTVPFLVDTGASVVAIDRDVAEKIGLDVNALRYTARIRTANGIASAAPVVIPELQVGSISRRDVAAVVTEGSGIGTSLLGMSFLGTLQSFEFRGDRLILTD